MFTTVIVAVICLQVVNSADYTIPKNLDLDDVLKNKRLVNNYVDCVLGEGKCTPEGLELKAAIPEALTDGCARCTDEHREGIRKVAHHLLKERRDLWEKLVARFDPNGEYKQKYTEYLEKEGLSY